MTRNIKLGLHGRLLGIGFNKPASRELWTSGAALAPDVRYRDLDVPTYLRRKLSIHGLRKRSL